MYEHVLRRMQRAVKAGKIRFRRHALEELANEGFVPHDAVNCIITGQIVEDQFDLVYQQTKYVIYGDSLAGREMGVAARWDDYHNVVVITAFQLTISDYD